MPPPMAAAPPRAAQAANRMMEARNCNNSLDFF